MPSLLSHRRPPMVDQRPQLVLSDDSHPSLILERPPCKFCSKHIPALQAVFMYNDSAFCSNVCRLSAFKADREERKLKNARESEKVATSCSMNKRRASTTSGIALTKALITTCGLATCGRKLKHPAFAPSKLDRHVMLCEPGYVRGRIVDTNGSKGMTKMGYRTVMVQLRNPAHPEWIGSVTACNIKWFSQGVWHTQLVVGCCRDMWKFEALLLDSRIPETTTILIGDVVRMRDVQKFPTPGQLNVQIQKDILWTKSILGGVQKKAPTFSYMSISDMDSKKKLEKANLQTCNACTIC
ncbi:hypothetical protein AAMO2058_001495300 [Amorphochlora amoebiformis]